MCDILENVPDVKFICLDVANGYSQFFVEYVAKVRKAFPTHTILAGNVVTGDMVEALIFAGADIVKVGIGPGSVCTTRKKTGVGYPQLSAVLECADNAHGLSAHIISVILIASYRISLVSLSWKILALQCQENHLISMQQVPQSILSYVS